MGQAQTTIDEGAIALHELFLSLMKAGFTRDEAFELIKVQWEKLGDRVRREEEDN